MVYIELPDGFDVNEINLETVMLNNEIKAEIKPIGVVGGILMVKLNRNAVIALNSHLLIPASRKLIIITGELANDKHFKGTDDIRVI